MLINIYDEVGKNAVSYDQSNKLYDLLKNNFKNEDLITIDFKDVEVVSSPFFNGSIGLMLKDINIEELQNKIKFLNIDDYTKSILNMVIANAINFYNGK